LGRYSAGMGWKRLWTHVYVRAWVGVSLMWLAGCSTFERDWKAAAAATRPAGVGGAWEGEWHSATGHGAGRLKCILSDGEQSGQYQARFRATFWGFLKAGYTIRLDGRE